MLLLLVEIDRFSPLASLFWYSKSVLDHLRKFNAVIRTILLDAGQFWKRRDGYKSPSGLYPLP